MVYKKYTDLIYVPIEKLKTQNLPFLDQIINYRSEFIEFIQIGNSFCSLTETPLLIKKRMIKNIDIKDRINFSFKTNDYIFELAIALVENKYNLINSENLIKTYKNNNNDLTIITEYLVNNIEEVLSSGKDRNEIVKLLPELSKKDLKFIEKNHNPDLSYTLEDYRDFNKVVYETARKALERLVSIGLYTKEKISKKFVYKATNKLIVHMKGSA